MANRASPYSTGWPFSISLRHDGAGDFGFDFVHQLHRFDDAQHLAGLYRVADLDERRIAGLRRIVVCAHDRRLHDHLVASGIAGAAALASRRTRRSRDNRFGARSRGCGDHGRRRFDRPANPHAVLAPLHFEFGNAAFHDELD